MRFREPVSGQLEPVLGPPKRKLKNGLQRLRLKSTRLATENRANTGQRPVRASLTRWNVGGSPTPANRTAETGLGGCPSWILIELCALRRNPLLGRFWRMFGQSPTWRLPKVRRWARGAPMISDRQAVESATVSAAAARMRAHRERRREGLHCVTVQLRATKLDELVRRGLLPSETRNDVNAIVRALHYHFDRTLAPKI